MKKNSILFEAEKTPAEKIGEKMMILLQNGIVPWYNPLPAINFITKKPYEPLNQCLLSVSLEDRLFATAQQVKHANIAFIAKTSATAYNVVTMAPQAYTSKGYATLNLNNNASFYKGRLSYHKVYGISEFSNVHNSIVERKDYKTIFRLASQFQLECSREAFGMKSPESIQLKKTIGLGFLGSLNGKELEEYTPAYFSKWLDILESRPTIFLRAARMAGKSLGNIVRG